MPRNYVATTKDNLESVLKKLKDGDTLLLFYYDEHKTVDISMLTVFAKSKINLELRKLPEENAEIFLAFELGKLSSAGSIVSISEDEIVSGFSEYLKTDNVKSRKPRERKAAPDTGAPVKKRQSYSTEPPAVPVSEPRTVREASVGKETPAVTSSDDFDAAFDEFIVLLGKLRTGEFDAEKSVQKILETIREVEINKGNMLKVCTAVFGSSEKDKAYTFITENYRKIKKPALRVIELDR